MNITITKSELLRALTVAHSIVEKKTTMPILANVLLSAKDEQLSISGTNLEITCVAIAKAKVGSEGKTTVNAKVLSEIVRELPETEINMTLHEGERLEIQADKTQFRMIGVSAEEFPSLPGMSLEVPGGVNAKEMLEMVNKTLYAVSHDETRFNLNGVCFESHDEGGDTPSLRMVATDGHRLAMITRPLKGFSFSETAIVPTKGLSEIRRILDVEGLEEVGVTISDGFFLIETPQAKVSMRLIDGEFPDYNQVLPKQEGVIAKIPSAALAQALRRAALMVTDRGKCVKMDFAPGALRISSSSPELGEASEELQVDYDGEPLSIGFNAKYILEFIGSLSEDQDLHLELNGELGPGKIFTAADDSYFGIVMPMRLT